MLNNDFLSTFSPSLGLCFARKIGNKIQTRMVQFIPIFFKSIQAIWSLKFHFQFWISEQAFSPGLDVFLCGWLWSLISRGECYLGCLQLQMTTVDLCYSNHLRTVNVIPHCNECNPVVWRCSASRPTCWVIPSLADWIRLLAFIV